MGGFVATYTVSPGNMAWHELTMFKKTQSKNLTIKKDAMLQEMWNFLGSTAVRSTISTTFLNNVGKVPYDGRHREQNTKKVYF